MVNTRPEFIDRWFDSLLANEEFEIRDYTLQLSEHWSLDGGFIRHSSGRFFSIIGIEATDLGGTRISQPLIDQREIGTLGLVMQQDASAGPSIYIQAKVEPGNIGLVQLAPSCQATASNADRVHGGNSPPLLKYFNTGSEYRLLSDLLQSEQGTRFYGKFNRNCLVEIDAIIDDSPYHRWISFTELAPLLHVDHLINTDARSTLVSAPWESFTRAQPFASRHDEFAVELLHSYNAGQQQAFEELESVRHKLEQARNQWLQKPEILPLEKLDTWIIDERGIKSQTGNPFRVEQIKVRANSREISSWDQPIVNSNGVGEIILLCGIWRNTLHFLFMESIEIGFINRVELTPAGIVTPGGNRQLHPYVAEIVEDHTAEEIISCRQSEEGGRFLHDENIYSIIFTRQEIDKVPAPFHWLTLWQIKQLVDEGKRVTNEARSAISLLLAWL